MTFFIKALVLVIFIFLNIFLLYQEFKLIEHKNIDLRYQIANSKSSQQFLSESSHNKRLSQYFLVYGPALISYFSIFKQMNAALLAQARDSRNNNEFLTKEIEARAQLEQAKREIREEQSITESLKAKYNSQDDQMKDQVDKYKTATNNSMECQQTLNKIEQLKLKNGDLLTKTEQDLISEENYYKNIKIYNDFEATKINNAKDKITEVIQDEIAIGKRCSFFSFDFNEIINQLNQEEMLALCNLVFNQLILSNIIGITLIFYGDYLIKRFNLEIKYPKLAKLIQLRNKFKEFHLKISILLIILCVVPQIAMNIYILLPKLQSIFTG